MGLDGARLAPTVHIHHAHLELCDSGGTVRGPWLQVRKCSLKKKKKNMWRKVIDRKNQTGAALGAVLIADPILIRYNSQKEDATYSHVSVCIAAPDSKPQESE